MATRTAATIAMNVTVIVTTTDSAVTMADVYMPAGSVMASQIVQTGVTKEIAGVARDSSIARPDTAFPPVGNVMERKIVVMGVMKGTVVAVKTSLFATMGVVYIPDGNAMESQIAGTPATRATALCVNLKGIYAKLVA